MKEKIEQIIEDYKRRLQSASDLMRSTTSYIQYYQVNSKKEAYEDIIRELRQVIEGETKT